MVSLMWRLLQSKPAAASAVAFTVLAMTCVMSANPAHGEFKIRYPNIDYREVEIENNTSFTYDKHRNGNDRDLSTPTEIGVGILPFWFVELEFEAARHPGQKASLDALTFENYFMLTQPGQFFLDLGIFAEYSRALTTDGADSVKTGLLVQKEVDKTLHTLNLFIERDVGPRASNDSTFQYAWQSRFRFSTLFQPGFELYGQIDDISNPGSLAQQQLRIGPMFAGSYNLGQVGGRGKIKYEVGYLFGLTDVTESHTLRTRLEYEIPF